MNWAKKPIDEDLSMNLIRKPATGSQGGELTDGSQDIVGAKRFLDGIKVDDGAEQTPLNFFASGSFTVSFTGNGTSPGTSSPVTLYFHRVGGWVSLFIPAFSANPGSGTPTGFLSNGTLPAWARPATSTQLIVGGVSRNNNASSGEYAAIQVSASGLVATYRNSAIATYTASAVAGMNTNSHITYYVGTGS